jgi:hypothetical protein
MRGQGVTEIWNLLGHKQICPTVTIEWLEPTVGLIRFLYPGPADYPYRGVVNVHIEGTEYEFKGMVFHAKNDAPTFVEHRAIKRYLAIMGLIGKSRRLKNGVVVMKLYPGNSAQTLNCGEMKMSDPKLRITMEYLGDNGEVQSDVVASFYTMGYPQIVATQKAIAGALTDLGDQNVAAQAAQAA